MKETLADAIDVNFPDDLKTDYQFTFNLSKREDDHYTGINFMNIPSSVSIVTHLKFGQ